MTDRLFSLRKKRSTDKKRYYNQIRYPEIPLSMDDVYIITKDGDRLDLLAEQFYKDTELWWVISISNINKIKRDSFFIEPGTQIRIPQNVESIQDAFNE